MFGLPFGLALIVICGGELYTGNAAMLPAAIFEVRKLLRACHFPGNGGQRAHLNILVAEKLVIKANTLLRNFRRMYDILQVLKARFCLCRARLLECSCSRTGEPVLNGMVSWSINCL